MNEVRRGGGGGGGGDGTAFFTFWRLDVSLSLERIGGRRGGVSRKGVE